MRALRSDASLLTRVYAEVQSGIADTGSSGALSSRRTLQRVIIDSGLPLVVTGPGDRVLHVENLPFSADPQTEEGRARILDYVRRLDARNPPVGDPGLQQVHFGDPPEVRALRWIPWLHVGGLVLTVLTGVAVVRLQRRAESERAWTTMARELAHQLGTPISSLQGWTELLRMSEGDRPATMDVGAIAEEIEEDLQRLERISRRFEQIGHHPPLGILHLDEALRPLERYLLARLPRLGAGVRFSVEVPEGLPPIFGSEVLLSWALENLVKNSLDALAGRGGAIRVVVEEMERGWVTVGVEDTGPGIDPALRDRIFEPGVSTRPGGWGVGLVLARRIVEGVHGGRLTSVDPPSGRGARIEIRLPVAGGHRPMGSASFSPFRSGFRG